MLFSAQIIELWLSYDNKLVPCVHIEKDADFMAVFLERFQKKRTGRTIQVDRDEFPQQDLSAIVPIRKVPL